MRGSRMARRKTSPLFTRLARRRACSSVLNSWPARIAFPLELRVDRLAQLAEQLGAHGVLEHDVAVTIELVPFLFGHFAYQSRTRTSMPLPSSARANAATSVPKE